MAEATPLRPTSNALMLISMTGFGDAFREEAGLSVHAEVRSINSRFFKLNLRTSDRCGPFESRIETLIRKQVRRGTVNASIRVQRDSSGEDHQVNQVVLEGYYTQLKAICRDLHDAGTVGLESLLLLPGVIEVRADRPSDAESEAEWSLVESTLSEALEHLAAMRREEGAAMAADLTSNTTEIAGHLDEIDRGVPEMVATYQSKLTDRLNKLLEKHDISVDASDVVREVGLFAERTDIAEEIVRLRSHLGQFDKILTTEPSGKKLEFLIQEMLRETNTIGSKANNADVARHVVDIKTAIERMREQIQNCE